MDAERITKKQNRDLKKVYKKITEKSRTVAKTPISTAGPILLENCTINPNL